jgi:sec-independent protein translocase protein TatA
MLSISNLVVILLIIFVLFGAGKLPSVMGEMGKGIKNLRKGLKSDDESVPTETTKEEK